MSHGHETIIIIDFGSQYTQLITRRIREANVYSEIHPHTLDVTLLNEINLKGIIFSGGPMSVYDENALKIDQTIYSLNVPLLGICYGLNTLCMDFGGKVERSANREYGKTAFKLVNRSKLFKDVSDNSVVWMSHSDRITELPEGFVVNGVSDHTPDCAVSNESKNIYGVQFHPEVAHTEEGNKIINNFLFDICKCKSDWTPVNYIDEQINNIKSIVGTTKAICALSGGVDSTVAAVLVKRAIGDNLISIHIDNGLMRKNESEKVGKVFDKNLDLHHIHVDASERFLKALKGVTNPEEKRKIIGKTFIDVFEEEAAKFDSVQYLVQGTLYPDVIESVPVKGKSATIKTHHNVGGLPKKMKLKLIEPFRDLFKDEVRKVGCELGIAKEIINRHPFPGPGLAVRVPGEVNREKLDILREADEIFINSIKQAGLYDDIWQALAVLLPVSTVGVMGDYRTYEYVLALRAVTSLDGMTAHWYPFDNVFLENVSGKIINKVRGINRVVYDISSKPPATIEWE